MALTSLLYKQSLWERHWPLRSREAGEADKPTHVPSAAPGPAACAEATSPRRVYCSQSCPHRPGGSKQRGFVILRLGGQKSDLGLSGPESRCLQAWFPREGLGGSHVLAFQLLASVCVFWTVLSQLSHTSQGPFLHLQSQQRWVKFLPCALAPTSLLPPAAH